MNELKQQIATLEKRREELTAEIEEAKQDLDGVQNEVIEGVEGAGDRATTIQAAYTARKNALEALERRLVGKRADLAVAEEEARVTGVEAEREQIKADFAAADAERLKALETIRDTITEQIDRLDELGHEMDVLERQHRKLGQAIDAPPSRLIASDMPDLGRYADSIGKAIEIGVGIAYRERLKVQRNGRHLEPARA